MVGTVTSNLTNLTLAETGDGGNWDDLGGGAGSSQSGDLPIQGAETRARRIDNKIIGFGFDAGAAQDLSASGTHVGFWVNVLQPGQIGATQGLQFCISDSGTDSQSGNWDGHNFTAADYPATGGWQRVWVDLARTRDAGSGTLSTSSTRNFGCEFDMGDVGGNAANCHLDRIDYTDSGLALTAGTVGSPATFADIVSTDETNSYGVLAKAKIDAPVVVGGAATVFRDSNFAIAAGNQPLAETGWQRIDWDMSNASADLVIAGFGFTDGVHHTFTGTSGTCDLSGLIVSAAPLAITLNSAVTWSGSIVASPTLDQNGADIDGLTVSGSTSTVGLTVSDLTKFQNGSVIDCNRGIELSGAGPFTVDGVQFSGNTTDIRVNSASNVTVNLINGSNAATAENIGAGNVTLVNAVGITLSGLIAGSRVYIRNTTDAVDLFNETELTTTFTDSVNYAGDKNLLIRVRSASGGTKYKPFETTGVLTSTGYSLVVNQIIDQ